MIEVNIKLKVDTTELDRAIAKANELQNVLTGGPGFVFKATPSETSSTSSGSDGISTPTVCESPQIVHMSPDEKANCYI